MRTGPDKVEHDRMVRVWAEELVKDRWTVWADLDGWNRPLPVRGHIPDIRASKGVDRVIGEIETCESITWTQTRDQFAAFTRGRRGRTSFHAMAPASCLGNLKGQVREWQRQRYDITVDRFHPFTP